MLTAVQQVEGGGASLQGAAGEAPCTAAAAREIAGTTTTTAEGDDCGQPVATRTTKSSPKAYTD